METRLNENSGTYRLHNCNAVYYVKNCIDSSDPHISYSLDSYGMHVMTVTVWYSEIVPNAYKAISCNVVVHNNPNFSTTTTQHVYKFVRDLFGYSSDAYAFVHGCRYVYDTRHKLPIINITAYDIVTTIESGKRSAIW